MWHVIGSCFEVYMRPGFAHFGVTGLASKWMLPLYERLNVYMQVG